MNRPATIAATKMRKGNDFHKDKDVGKLSTLGPIRENTHVSSFLSLPNHFHGEWLLVVEAVIVFGSGVARLSVLTHTHTPPWLTSQWKKNHCDHSCRHSFSPCLC